MADPQPQKALDDTIIIRLMDLLEDMHRESLKAGEAEKPLLEIHDRILTLTDPIGELEDRDGRRELELQITRKTMLDLTTLARAGLQPQTPVEMQKSLRELADLVRRHNEMLETLQRV